MAYRSYVIVATICLFLLASDIETMIIYVIIYLFSEMIKGGLSQKKID